MPAAVAEGSEPSFSVIPVELRPFPPSVIGIHEPAPPCRDLSGFTAGLLEGDGAVRCATSFRAPTSSTRCGAPPRFRERLPGSRDHACGAPLPLLRRPPALAESPR